MTFKCSRVVQNDVYDFHVRNILCKLFSVSRTPFIDLCEL